MSRTFDSVVIGAGPAGLSAAAELSLAGRCLLLERGPAVERRDRSSPVDVLAGVGGAGLFSDGKHSRFPSATALWALPDRAALQASFETTAALLRRRGVELGALPDGPALRFLPAGRWHEKRYDSTYVPLAGRIACIDELCAESCERRTGVTVVDAWREGPLISVALVSDDGASETICTHSIVMAGGRWSPRAARPWLERLGARFAFRRLELGVRLEARADDDAFARLPGVDGKLVFPESESDVELRTFCTCRDGEVVLGRADGLAAFSGRADVAPTGRSSVGLVARLTDERRAREVETGLKQGRPVTCSLAEWHAQGAEVLCDALGPPGAALLQQTLQRFLTAFPSLATDASARLFAPCIEGVGDYALDDGSLCVAPGVWVAGDATGRFRGIVAGLISGRYAARRRLAAQAR